MKASSGRLVPDLTREEFRIFDDKHQNNEFLVSRWKRSVVGQGVLIDNDPEGHRFGDGRSPALSDRGRAEPDDEAVRLAGSM